MNAPNVQAVADAKLSELATGILCDFFYGTEGGVSKKFAAVEATTRNVKAFGATGNGQTDDSAAFQSAVDEGGFPMTVATGVGAPGGVVTFTGNLPTKYTAQPYGGVWSVRNTTDPTSLESSGNGVTYNIGSVAPNAANSVSIGGVATSIQPGDIIFFDYALKGTIYIPPGRYLINTPVRLSRGAYASFIVRGDGMASKIIAGNTSGFVFDHPTQLSGPIGGVRIFENLDIENGNPGGGLIRLNSVIGAMIRNCQLAGFRCIEMTNMQSSTIQTCGFASGGLAGAIAVIMCDNGSILDCDASGFDVAFAVGGLGVIIEGYRLEVNNRAIALGDPAIMGAARGFCSGIRIGPGSFESNWIGIDGGCGAGVLEGFTMQSFPGAPPGGKNPLYGIRIPGDKMRHTVIKGVTVGANFSSAALWLGDSTNRGYNVFEGCSFFKNSDPIYTVTHPTFDIATSTIQDGYLKVGTAIIFINNGDTLPTPLAFQTRYYVQANGRLSTTPAGAPITFGGSQSGIHVRRQPVTINVATATFTLPKHNFGDDTVVVFKEDNGNTLPTISGPGAAGPLADQVLYMLNVTDDTFQVSRVRNGNSFGGPLALTGSQSGVHLLTVANEEAAIPTTAGTATFIECSCAPTYLFAGMPSGTPDGETAPNVREGDEYTIRDGQKQGGGVAGYDDLVQGGGTQRIKIRFDGSNWRRA